MTRKSFAKITSLLLALVMIIGLVPVVSAETTDTRVESPAGDFVYRFDEDSRLIITGYKGTDSDIVIPYYIDGYPVREIDAFAFSENSNIRNVYIPTGVVTIADKAFKDCTNLESIVIENSATTVGASTFDGTAFYNNADNWEDGVLYIGTHLIAADKDIEGSCVLKTGTSHIAEDAFKDCKNLTRVIFSDELLSIGSDAFYGCESLEIVRTSPNVTAIGESAFTNCSEDLKFISADDDDDFFPTYCENRGYTYMASDRHLNHGIDFVFIDGEVLVTGSNGSSEVTIPYSINGCYVTEVLDGAFRNKTNITKLTVNTKCTRIGDSAFENCTSLNNIIFYSNDMLIGKNAFKNTAAYNNENRWKNGIFYISGYAIDAKEDLKGTARLPYDTYSIASEAFRDCKNVEKVVIPEGVRIIGNSVFKGCESLTYVKIPSTLKAVENNAFKYSGEGLELYCPVSYEYAESCAKENNVPLNIIDKYTVYNEEWDITMTALDDLTFEVEEIDKNIEELQGIDEALMGCALERAYIITIIDPYTGEEVDPYTEVLIKAPLKSDALCEFWCEVDSNDNVLGYYIEPYEYTEIKDGYVEFPFYQSAPVAEINFSTYSTVDEATGIEITLPTVFTPEIVEIIPRPDNENSDFFDQYLPENAEAYAFVHFEASSEIMDNLPPCFDIVMKIPTDFENILVYKNYDQINEILIAHNRVKTADGFVTITFSGEDYYDAFLLATVDELPTEPSDPSVPVNPTEPADPEESKPATDPAEGTTTTEPEENSTPTDSEGTASTDASDSTNPSDTAPDSDFALGDVNRDGKLNIRDATLIQKFLAKLADLDAEQKVIADFNQDTKINIKDVTTIQKKIANLI